MKLFTAIAQTLAAKGDLNYMADRGLMSEDAYRANMERNEAKLERLIDNLPSGSGFNSGCKLDDSSKPDRLVISADFHHMDENGSYDGWTTHQVIVTPSLAYGYNLRVTGRNRNDIKSYIADVFHYLQEIEE